MVASEDSQDLNLTPSGANIHVLSPHVLKDPQGLWEYTGSRREGSWGKYLNLTSASAREEADAEEW